MTNTKVGTNVDTNANGKTTQTITTINVGDLVVLVTQVSSTTIFFSSMSSSRITWSTVGHVFGPSPMAMGLSLFAGIVNSVGSDTITGTPSAAIGAVNSQWTAAQFHTDSGLPWAVDNAQFNTTQNGSAGTALTMPALTSGGSNRVAAGVMVPEGTGTAGSTSGYTYIRDGYTSLYAYHLAITSGAITPATATMTSGRYVAAGALFVPLATGTGTAPLASGTGSAGDPKPNVAPHAELASGTGSAGAPTINTSSSGVINAEPASGTGAAGAPRPSVSPHAELASGAGTAAAPKPTVSPHGEIASGTGSAGTPKPNVEPHGGQATGTGVAQTVTNKASPHVPAGHASGGGAAGDPAVNPADALPALIATYTDSAASALVSVSVTSVVAGDWLVAVVGNGYTVDADLRPTGDGGGTYVAIGEQLGSPNDPDFENMGLIAWRKTATTSGTHTVELDLAHETTLVVLHVRGAIAIDGLCADRVVSQSATPSATQAIGPVTTVSTQVLLVGAWAGIKFSAFSWSTPAGMIERADIADPSNASRLAVSTQALAAAGDTGTRSSTGTLAPSFGFAGKLFAIRADGVPGDGESGPGIDPGDGESDPETPPPTTGGGAPSTTEAAVIHGWGTPLPSSDEFDYTGDPNPVKWGVYGNNGTEGGEECWVGHNGNGRRCVANATVADGYLRVTGETGGDTTGLAHQHSRQYGRWEVRGRWFATGGGTNAWHPVYILWPDGDRWPEWGEYDFVENNVGDTTLGAFLHYPHPNLPVEQIHKTGPTLDFAEWHNFGFEWTAQGLKGYIDGEEWFSVSGGGGPNGRSNVQNMPSGHLTIQLDAIDAETGFAPAVFDTEWVRVYDLTGPGPGGGSGGGPSGGGGTIPETVDPDAVVEPPPPDPEAFPAGHPILAGTMDAALLVQAAFGADLTEHPNAWSWTDITPDVRQRDRISMRHGRRDEAATTQPATCSFTLDNTSGAYSLGPQSSHWPYVRRNTPIRVAVDPDGGTAFVELFVGFADRWQPAWGPAGRNPTVELSASGTLRRILQGIAPAESAFRRAMRQRSDLLAYWPCEDTDGAIRIASALPDGIPMDIGGTADSPWPDWSKNDDFACSDKLPEVRLTTWRGSIPRYEATGQVQFRFLTSLPTDPLSGTEAVLAALYTSGTAGRWDLVYVNAAGGALALRVVDATGTLTELFYVAFAVDGSQRWWSLELAQNGANIQWAFRTLAVGEYFGVSVSGTFNSQTLGRASAVAIGPNGDVLDAAVGQITVQSALTSITRAGAGANALNAYAYEFAHTRVARLCREAGVHVDVVGTSAVQMGPQPLGKLVELLRECETADAGLLYDGVSGGLVYVCGAQRVNAAAAITVTSAQLVGDLTVVDDDQRTRNRVTAKRTAGGEAAWEDTDGPLGTAVVGLYDDKVEVNIGATDDLIDYASRAVAAGTATGYRHPAAELALHRNPSLAAAWLAAAPSSRLDITGLSTLRTQHPTGTVSQLIEGYSQQLDQFRWDITANLSPAQPWRGATWGEASGDTSDTVLRVDTGGSQLASSALVGATSLSVATTSGPLWTTAADDMPMRVEVGGIEVTVNSVSGASSPQTFTVDGSTVTKALTSAAPVALWLPLGLTL